MVRSTHCSVGFQRRCHNFFIHYLMIKQVWCNMFLRVVQELSDFFWQLLLQSVWTTIVGAVSLHAEGIQQIQLVSIPSMFQCSKSMVLGSVGLLMWKKTSQVFFAPILGLWTPRSLSFRGTYFNWNYANAIRKNKGKTKCCKYYRSVTTRQNLRENTCSNQGNL